MAPANRQERWFIDITTDQIYRVVWASGDTVLLESDEFVRFQTTTWTLEKLFKPLVTVTH